MFSAIGKIFGRSRSPSPAARGRGPAPNFADLSHKCYFSESELRKLYDRFNLICSDEAFVSAEAFYTQPEVSNCRLIVIAFEHICPPDGAARGINFTEYILILSKFSTRASKEEKLKCRKRIFLLIHEFLF